MSESDGDGYAIVKTDNLSGVEADREDVTFSRVRLRFADRDRVIEEVHVPLSRREVF